MYIIESLFFCQLQILKRGEMNMENHEVESILQACACASLRTVSRALTQLYNQILQATGLKITQYYMLVTIYQYKKRSISELSDIMMLDQTTITRKVDDVLRNESDHVERQERDSRRKWGGV